MRNQPLFNDIAITNIGLNDAGAVSGTDASQA